MNLDFDFRDFQKESSERLAKIFSESMFDQEQIDHERSERTYHMIRKLLDCPRFEKCHPFLYTLDQECVNEQDTEKVNKLYNLALEKGFIKEDGEENTDSDIQKECDDVDGSLCGGPADAITDQPMIPQEPAPAPETKPIYTVLYSASRNGNPTMGEFYSMASGVDAAKDDCTNTLSSNGYSDIMIMAVEQTNPSVNTDVSYQDPSVNMYDKFNEDDSEEYLKQETGDTSDDKGKTDKPQGKEEKKSEEKPAEDTEKKEDAPKTDDSEKEDKVEDTEDKEEEKTEDTEKKDDEEGKKLTGDEKNALKEEYTKLFKDTLKKLQIEKSVEEMSLEERTDFWNKIAEKWQGKNDPADFLSDKDQEKLNKIVIKSSDNEEDKSAEEK